MGFDVNLAKDNEGPIPLNGMNLLEAADLVTQAVQDDEEMLRRRFTGEEPERTETDISTGTPHAFDVPNVTARFFLDMDRNVYRTLTWSFCSLPGELRNRIYKLVLVPGPVYPHAEPTTQY